MFEFVRKHTKLLQLLLVLLIFPSFIFFGIQGYSRFMEGGAATVAKVDGKAITRAEFDQAHQRQVERMRRQLPGVDVKLFDNAAARLQTLDAVVNERLLLAAAYHENLLVGDERLRRIFHEDPQFAALRNPDGTVNQTLLQAQGMSSEAFVAQLRQELAMQQVLRGVSTSGFASAAEADVALDALFQRRSIAFQRFDAKAYRAKITPSDADLDAYYKTHEAEFRAPEQATIDYVVLDLDAVKKGITVSDADLHKYYDENRPRYTAPEERHARHILIAVDAGASAEAKGKAKARAEALLEQVRKSPASFAELAKKNSDDTGSAPQGGDLGWSARGALASKALEDAVFALKKPGEIAPLVSSEFGYHVVQLEGTRGGEVKPFDAVRAAIVDEVTRQLATKRWAEAAEQFTNTVYEQPDSLQPVIDKLKLDKRSATVTRQPAPGATGALASAKLLDAVFGNENVRNKKNNTDAVEVGANQLAAAHVTQYQPARTLPLGEVRDRVRERVIASRAAELARKDGEARLAQLKAGGGELPDKATVSRQQRNDLPAPAIDAVLRADAGKLPAWLGVDLGDQGYLVARIDAVLPREATADDAAARQQYAQAWSNAETRAYLDALKLRYKVELRTAEIAAPAASEAAR